MFAKGELSGVGVREITKAAKRDGWGHGDAMAGMLAGRMDRPTTSNASRDIWTAIRNSGVADSMSDYVVEVQNGKKVHINIPHECLAKRAARQGTRGWFLPEDDIEGRSTPLARLLRSWGEHPDVQVAEEDLKNTVLLDLHADGTQYTTSVRVGTFK